MIEFDHVTKRFGAWTAIDDVSFTVDQGALCVLIGGSGAGKSTLLRMVNRLLEQDAGTIRVDGEEVFRFPVEQLRRRIGYVIQSVGLFPHWTVERNIATVPQLLRWPRARIRDRVTYLLELLQMNPDQFRSRYPHQLSGGERQRIGVARALAADPSVLLMDEPFAALDPLTREISRGELARIHRETGKTIIFVTHDMTEALALATRMAILDRGRLVQFATPREILTTPADAFVREFVGREDQGLKLLSLETVGSRMRPVADETGTDVAGEPLRRSAPLLSALSEMITRRADRLPVQDEAGRPVGSLHLVDLVRR